VTVTDHAVGTHGIFGVRSADTRISDAEENIEEACSVLGALQDIVYKGNAVLCRVRLADGTIFAAIGEPEAKRRLQANDIVRVSWPPQKAFLFTA
jgi:hypothetical protein